MTVTVINRLTRGKVVYKHVDSIYDAGARIYICTAAGAVTVETGYNKAGYKFIVTK